MDKLAVNGDSIVLQPVGFLWQAWDGKLPLKGANLITSEGKSVILETDVMTAALQGMGKMYVAPPFATPGSVVNLQLTVIPATLSLSVSVQGQAVVTAMTMGTYTATVVPAMNPQGIPDPLLTKVGQWTVETTSQSSFRSGMPVPLGLGENDSAKGDGKSDEAESEDHWIGVSVEDVEGNPLANQHLSLELCNGETVQRVLGDSGAVRLDAIVVDEDVTDRTCIVRLVFDPNRVPVRTGPVGSIAVQVVDDNGDPFAGREVTLTLPDGSILRRTLDDLGRTRFVGVPERAKCRLEIAPGQVLLEFTLVDEDGVPLAGKPFKVVDSQGVLVEGVLDDDGFGSCMVAEGECDVTIDFDANADADARNASVATTADGIVTPLPGEGAVPVDQGTAHVLDVVSALFRLESAVVMPEGESPDPNAHGSLSLVGIFAAALRYNQEHPETQLLLAGHADTSGGTEFNQALSLERAKVVLAVLEGDRETFCTLAEERHQIADYKQILSWCSQAFPQFFACDPGAIDDQEFTGVAPLRLFQAQYNEHLDALGGAASIDVDGSIGPETWSAFFDVYQFGLGEELGEDRTTTKVLQGELRFVDTGRKALGFGEHQPTVASGDGVREQGNRRVELLYFESDKTLPDLAAAETDPAGSEIYDKTQFTHLPLQPMVSAKRWTASWENEAEPTNADQQRQLRLSAAGAPDGTPLSFSIEQLIEGEPSGITATLEAMAGDQAAEALFDEWYNFDLAVFAGDLSIEQNFPRVSFRYVVTGGGRRIVSSVLDYADFVDLTLMFAGVEDGEAVPVSEAPFVAHTAWGRRVGRTSKQGRIFLQGLPPGGAHIIPSDHRLVLRPNPPQSGGEPVEVETIHFLLRLVDAQFRPRSGVQYTLISGVDVRENFTNEDGMIDERLNKTGHLITLIYDEYEFVVEVGALPAVGEVEGARRRLSNLGYDVGAGATLDPVTALALRLFHRARGLAEPRADAELLSSAAQSALLQAHGS